MHRKLTLMPTLSCMHVCLVFSMHKSYTLEQVLIISLLSIWHFSGFVGFALSPYTDQGSRLLDCQNFTLFLRIRMVLLVFLTHQWYFVGVI